MSTPTTVPGTSVTIEPGRLVAGRYLLLARVGRGGSGSVWRARDELLDREVAVKRLHIGQAEDAWRSGKLRERAYREGRVAARLHHPRLAAIHDITEIDGHVCLVMEYVAAPSLADRLDREGPLPAARVVHIGAQIAEGLAAMHRAGVVHRDIKPANILIGPDDTVTVTDFGIAVVGTDPGADGHVVAGTPKYMAPETALGAVPTTAADMFSLGATLHAALVGTPPRPGAPDVLEALPDGAGDVGTVLRALLDVDPGVRPSAPAAARLLAETAPEGGRRAGDTAREETPTPRHLAGGRHRAVLSAWPRPSRRAVVMGATGLVAVLAAGTVALSTGSVPSTVAAPPAASHLGPPAPSLPLAGPPIVPATPSTLRPTSIEVASAARARPETPEPASTGEAAGSDDDQAPAEDREDGPGNSERAGNNGKGPDKKGGQGRGGGRGN